MPAIGNSSNFRALPPKPAPKPPPPVPAMADRPHGSGVISTPRPAAPRPASAYTAPAARTVVPDARPHGSGTLTKATPGSTQPQSAYANQQSYAQTVLGVFKAQSPAQQRAVVQGAVKSPTIPESKIILGYVEQQNAGRQFPGVAAINGPQLAGVFRATTAPTFLSKLLVNAAKDAWNLPSGTVEGLYGLGKQGVEGGNALLNGNLGGAVSHYGTAAHMFIDPYVRFAEHPISTAEQHPLNTALMLAAPEALLGKGAGFAARAGAFGEKAAKAASTVREPLSLGTIAGEPSPIVEERNYSPDVFKKAVQRSREGYIRARGRNPNIAGPAPRLLSKGVQQALNVGAPAKLRRISDEMTSVRQMAGRGERAQAAGEAMRAAPPKTVRNVVSHILQGVVRTPKTAVEDITKEINRLKAARTGKRTAGEIMNRKQVRDLSTALQHPEDLPKAFQAADALRARVNAQDAGLLSHGLIDPEQAMRSKLMPYAMAHMGAKPFKGLKAQFEGDTPLSARLENADGSTLHTQDILDHLKANGVPDPAYVGHFPGKVSPARFYQTYKLARGSIGQAKRTGEAFRSGAYDHTFQGLVGQLASRAETLTKASLHDRVVSRLGVLKPQELRKAGENGMFTPGEARAFAHAALHDDNGNPIPNATELTPISAAPAHVLGLVKDLQNPSELQNISGVEMRALAHAIDDARTRTDGTRNVVLIPTVAAQRFAEQFSKTDSTLRSIGKVTQQFRRTVLPYSTHWMTQIGSEAAIRAMIGGALDPRYLRDGKTLMKRLEKTEPGRAAGMEMVNATFYNKSDPLAVHNPNPGVIASGAKAFPPTRVLIAAHNRYADTIGHAMYGLEHNARLLGLGKLAHQDVQSFGFSWKNAVRLQGSAIEDLARRLETNPALVAKFGRAIDDTFGKYNKFSPKVRAAIQSYAPFLPWYLNAAKYVLWHLPAHHPVASALLASLRQTINQDVADGKQAPLNTYAMQELARISPFGIFTPSSTTPSTGAALSGQQITGAILPQLQGSAYNLAGINSFGAGPLKGPHGDVKAQSGPALAAALENALEAFLPGARYARLAEAGGKPTYGTSSILSPQPKAGQTPGNAASIVKRIFNPFYSVQSASKSGPAYGTKSGAASGAPSIPGGGSLGGAVIPDGGSLNGAVIP